MRKYFQSTKSEVEIAGKQHKGFVILRDVLKDRKKWETEPRSKKSEPEDGKDVPPLCHPSASP